MKRRAPSKQILFATIACWLQTASTLLIEAFSPTKFDRFLIHVTKRPYSFTPCASTTKPADISDASSLEVRIDDSFIHRNFEDTGTPHPQTSSPKEIEENVKDVATSSTSLPQSRPFPFTMIVNHDIIKHALLLAAINPKMGGVVISGGRGTAKSVLARAMQRLLPPQIERIKGSQYNIDAAGVEGVDSDLNAKLLMSGDSIENLETELVNTPFVQIPINVQEDSLLGTVDLEASLEKGRPIFSPGLLAKCHRGILYVDEINLLDEEAANILLNVIADGYVTIERESISIQYPCRPLLIATYNPEEGELREHLLDRIAVELSADEELTIEERLEAVEHVLGFSGGTTDQASSKATNALQMAEEEEASLRETILSGRKLLPDVKIDKEQLLYLCEEATRAGCEGQRAEIFATEISKASSALHGRTSVNAGDLRTGVMLSILPRALFIEGALEAGEHHTDTSAPPPPASSSELEPIPPPPEELQDKEDTDNETEHEDDDEKEDEKEDESEEDELEIPEEFMLGVKAASIDPKLLKFNRWTRRGKGGKRSRIFNLERGRYIKPIFPKGDRIGKLAVGATLRAAAPHQKFRRLRAKDSKKNSGKVVFITKDDFRIQRLARKAGSLVIFLVDASGSMALNRMDAAKGAALSLLQESYKCRDKICLIAFSNEKADVLFPPTKSSALTKDRLESMPCGGGSPLAHGK